mmetsp:Transcript_18082/g.50188  ORF Transcript_18082/g.50188 Transcript_18082/m.50188 type:complete len:87 (-) Transcript_18082:915-1175(-)
MIQPFILACDMCRRGSWPWPWPRQLRFKSHLLLLHQTYKTDTSGAIIYHAPTQDLILGEAGGQTAQSTVMQRNAEWRPKTVCNQLN